jgi:hypothetical protein
MRIRILLTFLLLVAVTASGADYSVKKNEWLFIPVSLPEAKIGGGDFYTLQLESGGDDNATVVAMVAEGVKFRSARSGIFNLHLVVNHVTKSSCAGVEVKLYRTDQFAVRVAN